MSAGNSDRLVAEFDSLWVRGAPPPDLQAFLGKHSYAGSEAFFDVVLTRHQISDRSHIGGSDPIGFRVLPPGDTPRS
jgi:hypothetical protein